MNLEEIIFFFVIFGLGGVASEVFFTAIHKIFKEKKNRTLYGYSSIWMFFIYGAVFFIILFGTTYFSQYSIFLRGLIYMIMIYLLEFCSGFLLKKFKLICWDYSKDTKYHFKGIISLEFAPIWYFGGIAAELIYLYLKAHLLF